MSPQPPFEASRRASGAARCLLNPSSTTALTARCRVRQVDGDASAPPLLRACHRLAAAASRATPPRRRDGSPVSHARVVVVGVEPRSSAAGGASAHGRRRRGRRGVPPLPLAIELVRPARIGGACRHEPGGVQPLAWANRWQRPTSSIGAAPPAASGMALRRGQWQVPRWPRQPSGQPVRAAHRGCVPQPRDRQERIGAGAARRGGRRSWVGHDAPQQQSLLPWDRRSDRALLDESKVPRRVLCHVLDRLVDQANLARVDGEKPLLALSDRADKFLN